MLVREIWYELTAVLSGRSIEEVQPASPFSRGFTMKITIVYFLLAMSSRNCMSTGSHSGLINGRSIWCDLTASWSQWLTKHPSCLTKTGSILFNRFLSGTSYFSGCYMISFLIIYITSATSSREISRRLSAYILGRIVTEYTISDRKPKTATSVGTL